VSRIAPERDGGERQKRPINVVSNDGNAIVLRSPDWSSQMKKMLVAAASLVTGALLVVSAASAQPPSGSSSSLQLVVLNGVAAPAGTAASVQASYGNQVTFNLQTSSSEPWVSVTCSQNGRAVYGQYWGFWSGYSPSSITSTMAAGGVFTLGSALWSSGSASCTATLYTVNAKNWKQTVLSTLPFTVSA
jgi:hypothetical protein